MKIAILGGKSLLDIVFLNLLSEDVPDLDIECFFDSGEVSFGSRRLVVQPIEKLDVTKFGMIINFSTLYPEVLQKVKAYNQSSENKIKYFNTIEGKLSFSDMTESLESLILIPNFCIEPIVKALNVFSSFSNIVSLNLVLAKPIAELGKDEMHRFHKEVKESHLRVVQHGEQSKEALAFNVSFSYPEDQNPNEFQESFEEAYDRAQLKEFFSELPMSITELRVPVNKGASVILNLTLSHKTDINRLKKMFEEAGFIYGRYGFSSILVENDPQIYFTKLKSLDGKSFTVVLLFDSIQRYIINIIELMLSYLVVKN